MEIKDLLTINLDEEINTVVDLDTNPSEAALKEGLDSFVLTTSLGKHLYDFLQEFNAGSMQSGIWLSGFYGSGKSYFAQIIGLLLQNRDILGTHIRDRFALKIAGLPNEDLLKTELGSLSRFNNIVVSFDASKHNNINGLPFMIFSSFLRRLGMTDTWHGIIEYDIFLEGHRQQFLDAVKEVAGKDWSEVIKSNTELIKTFKPALLKMGYSEEEYKELKSMAEAIRKEYDAARLKQDLSRYLAQAPDTRIVFFIDEVSEAITQKKIRLDDLEGIAEALADLGRKVWTIAIAQQRLDDVIKSENIALNSLTKVRDRFRSKIAIEADEVDTIIRHRLLAKTEASRAVLRDYFNENNGVIADVTNIGVPSLRKTDNVETYIDYYPFYMHQFKLLQYFLFGSSELTQTRVGNRGMIISAFDVLKKEVKHQTTDHYHVNATQLCQQADDRVEEALSNRYRQAEDALAGENFEYVSGKKLLQTIHFLTKSEVTHTTADNIAKSYLNRPENYHDILHEVKKALAILLRAQIVIATGEQYRITNEAEQRILDDMRRFDVQTWEMVQDVNKVLKNRDFVKQASILNVGGMNVPFKVATADGEVFANADDKYLRIILSDLLNTLGCENSAFIDSVRQETADAKGKLTIIPTTKYRSEIRELAVELRRLKYISEKTNLTDQEKLIINALCSERDAKETRFRELIGKSYLEGVAVYCFNKFNLSPETFRGVVSEEQLKMFENIFTKRLSAELRDSMAHSVFSKQPAQLHNFFGSSPDFKFFDTSGTFIGNNLTVVTEILSLCLTFTSGKDLENKLAGPPTGFSLGTIMTTLAALFRGDKIIVKFNGDEYMSWKKDGATDAFRSARNFAKASFKAVSQSLTNTEKRDIIDILKDCGYTKLTRNQLSYQLNDFEVVDAIRSLSKEMISRINNRIEAEEEYRSMFPISIAARQVFQQYQSQVTEANYLRTARTFLMSENSEEFEKAVERVVKDIKFIDEKMRDIRHMVSYIDEVKDQFEKASGSTEPIQAKVDHFNRLYGNDIVANYNNLKEDTQEIRDIYIGTYKKVATKTEAAYKDLLQTAAALKAKLEQYPREWNTQIWNQLSDIERRCKPYKEIATTFDTYSVSSLGSRVDLRAVTSALDSVYIISPKLIDLDSQVRTTDPNPSGGNDGNGGNSNGSGSSDNNGNPSGTGNNGAGSGSGTGAGETTPPAPKVQKLKNHIPHGNITIDSYRTWLTRQLTLLKSFGPNDLINLDD